MTVPVPNIRTDFTVLVIDWVTDRARCGVTHSRNTRSSSSSPLGSEEIAFRYFSHACLVVYITWERTAVLFYYHRNKSFILVAYWYIIIYPSKGFLHNNGRYNPVFQENILIYLIRILSDRILTEFCY